MIDTLARHLAALQESRRLMVMVLARNPSFSAWRDRGASAEGEADDPQLASDRYFQAYRHIQSAIDLLEPEYKNGRQNERQTECRDTAAQLRLIATVSALVVRDRHTAGPPETYGLATVSGITEALDQVQREHARDVRPPGRIEQPLGTIASTGHPGTEPVLRPRPLPIDEAVRVEHALSFELNTSSPPNTTVSAISPESARVPQPAARIVNDSLVYTAPKWTEASVEIVRSRTEALPSPEPSPTPRRTGWFRRLASAG